MAHSSRGNNALKNVEASVPDYMTEEAVRQPFFPPTVSSGAIYDFQTRNKSFLIVQQQLGLLGIKNNAFHLILLNPALQGVDPYDKNLTPTQVMMIIQECKLNIFYYLREVVRIQEDGGNIVPFRMDRGTLAATFCFINNINFYLMKPRQTGKTVGITALLSWAFKFSGPNSSFLFGNYKEDGSKKNLRAMRNILQSLPSYLANAGLTTVDNSGKTVRKTDNIKSYVEPATNNQAMVASSPSTEQAADIVGRGYTQAYQYLDEAEFIAYIDVIMKVSGMAFNTASRNAEKNGSGYCRILTTTPGDLGNAKTCQRALKIVEDALPWDEKFYDIEDTHELKQTVKAKSAFRFIYIEYDYKQLGLGEDWFIDACSNVGNDVTRIRREILLQRISGSSDSPFEQEELDDLVANCKKPMFVKTVGKIYDILFYEKPKKKRLYFISVDPSDGTGGDNYAITIMDPYTLHVVAEFRSPYMTIHGCNDLVNFMVDNYFPKALIIVERNRNGGAVIEVMKQSKLRNMIYSTPEANSDTSRVRDKMDENGFIKEEFIKNKYFGATTTSNTRAVMMNILVDAVHFAKDIVNTKYIVEDITNLIVKNDKIQAASGKHDDNVMSWLIGLYVYYYGERLERYGFRKNELPTDIEEDDEFSKLKKLYANPEIKKQFPTIYAYYQSEKAKHDSQERTKQEKEKVPETRIGGLDSMSKTHEIEHDPVVGLDVSIDGIPTSYRDNDEESWRRSVVRRFMNINK